MGIKSTEKGGTYRISLKGNQTKCEKQLQDIPSTAAFPH